MALDIAALLGKAFLVELVFLYPGFSWYGVEAMLNKDLFAIISVVLIIGIAYTVANILIDMIIAYLDPRVRFGGSRSA
jgi:peptide/nickel transport system permease protein